MNDVEFKIVVGAIIAVPVLILMVFDIMRRVDKDD